MGGDALWPPGDHRQVCLPSGGVAPGQDADRAAPRKSTAPGPDVARRTARHPRRPRRRRGGAHLGGARRGRLGERADGIVPTEIMPLKRAVEVANLDALYEPTRRRPSPTHYWRTTCVPCVPRRPRGSRATASSSTTARRSPNSELRTGAQVMLLRNDPPPVGTLVNGRAAGHRLCHAASWVRRRRVQGRGGGRPTWTSLPTATVLRPDRVPRRGIRPGETPRLPHEFVKDVYGKGTPRAPQLPLPLCPPITVHKTQGATLDCARVDLAGTFCEGQAYDSAVRPATTTRAGRDSQLCASRASRRAR